MAKDEKNEKVKKEATNFQNPAQVMDAINKKLGAGSIMRYGNSPIINIEAISTGDLRLDVGLGIGGVPRGRIVEVFGPESSGKTTLCLSIVKQAQKKGLTAAYVDAEHALDPNWAKNIGVDMDNLSISQPDSGEEALSIVEMLAESKQYGVVVVDSVAALVPQAEIDGEITDNHIGLQARLMSKALRKLSGIASNSNCTIVFINQIRHKIGVMYGSPETTSGGNALKFYASVRMDIRKVETIKEGDNAVGNKVKVKVIKNKVAPPFKEVTSMLYFGSAGYPYGIDFTGSIIDLAVEKRVIEKGGSWYSFGGIRLGNGLLAACKYLLDNPTVLKEIESKVRKLYEPTEVPAVIDSEEESEPK